MVGRCHLCERNIHRIIERKQTPNATNIQPRFSSADRTRRSSGSRKELRERVRASSAAPTNTRIQPLTAKTTRTLPTSRGVEPPHSAAKPRHKKNKPNPAELRGATTLSEPFQRPRKRENRAPSNPYTPAATAATPHAVINISFTSVIGWPNVPAHWRRAQELNMSAEPDSRRPVERDGSSCGDSSALLSPSPLLLRRRGG